MAAQREEGAIQGGTATCHVARTPSLRPRSVAARRPLAPGGCHALHILRGLRKVVLGIGEKLLRLKRAPGGFGKGRG